MKITNLIKPGNLIVCRAHHRHLVYWDESTEGGHIAHRSRYLEKDKVALVCDVMKLDGGIRRVVYECAMLIDGCMVKAQGTHVTWKEIWASVE